MAGALYSLACLLLAPERAPAQAAVGGVLNLTPNQPAAPADAKPTPSFTLPAQPADVKDSIVEFQQLVKREAWDRAFKSLDEIASKSSTGFIDRGDGVLLPGRLLARSLLAELPSAGKNAYRIFFDAQAEALWDKAAEQAELENLSTIVDKHLISSIGDRAADRLGDLYFERGDLEQAVSAWRSLAAYCLDSKIPKAQTLLKIATALARRGRWSDFHEIELTIADRYASDMVQVGGKQIAAAELIARLASGASKQQPSTATALAADIALPVEAEPMWQFRYQSKVDPLNPSHAFPIVDVYGRSRINDFPIPAIADVQRVYLDLFGIDMAFDLETGKLLWRSGKLHQLQLQQNRQGVLPERYAVKRIGDDLWTVSRDPQQLNQHPYTFSLTTRDAASGKEKLDVHKALSSWNILSEPCAVGDVLYVGACRASQGREVTVLVLSAKDGKQLKTINLGNHQVDQNQVYSERIAQPSFLAHRDRVFVDTNGGALIAIDSHSGLVDWGVMYDSPSPPVGYYYEYGGPQTTSSPLVAGGLLFSKGMRSTRLIGVRIDGPSLVWNRPVLKSAMIIGADDQRIYMGGEELTAYSLKTQELLWSTQLPRTAPWATPLLTQNRIYQFTSRGICELDKQTGQVTNIFRGADLESFGGNVLVTPQALVTVSNVAITAYPWSRPGEKLSSN